MVKLTLWVFKGSSHNFTCDFWT